MTPLGASGVAPTPLAEFVDRVLATLTRDALSLFEDLRVAYADVLEQHAATNPVSRALPRPWTRADLDTGHSSHPTCSY